MARNANMGWQLVPEWHDILYCGDDVRLIEPDTIARLRKFAYSDDSIGIASPKVVGNCWLTEKMIGFVFVYIKRKVINAVGALDERFHGYGCEDVDYCYRTRRAGFTLAVAPDITVRHGLDPCGMHQTTFGRLYTQEQMAKQEQANWDRFADKWGLKRDWDEIMKFVEGPVSERREVPPGMGQVSG
jgi:hypothetical protein